MHWGGRGLDMDGNGVAGIVVGFGLQGFQSACSVPTFPVLSFFKLGPLIVNASGCPPRPVRFWLTLRYTHFALKSCVVSRGGCMSVCFHMASTAESYRMVARRSFAVFWGHLIGVGPNFRGMGF